MVNNQFIMRSAYKELIRELTVLAEMTGAHATCLNILENLPYELQPKIIFDLAKSKNPRIIPFLNFIIRETQGDLKKEAQKALVIFEALGYDVQNQAKKLNIEKTAYISQTRLTGSCILVFLTKTFQEYQAHYFTLNFNHLGIKEYFQHSSLRKEELLLNINAHDLAPVHFSEAQKLLLDAYSQNERFGTKAAKGFSQYQNFLTYKILDEVSESQDIRLDLYQGNLSEQIIINAYLLALKNLDASLVYDLASPSLQATFGLREEFIINWTHPFENATFLKSQIKEVVVEQTRVIQYVQLVISDGEDELKCVEFKFELTENNGYYCLENIDILSVTPIGKQDQMNPLNYRIYTSVFKINNYQEVENFLEQCESIHNTGDFEYGLCYKWFKNADPLVQGIDIAQGVFCEFILTDTELIVFGADLTNVSKATYLLLEKLITKNRFHVYLTTRTICTIREVYQVINNPDYLLTKYFGNQESSYLIPPGSYDIWYEFCETYGRERNLLDKKVKSFQFSWEDKVIEVIFHGNYGFINAYACSLEEAVLFFDFPKAKTFTAGELLKDTHNTWQKLKLLRILSRDIFIKAYIPYGNLKQVARELHLVHDNTEKIQAIL